jgi:hypothetical protein
MDQLDWSAWAQYDEVHLLVSRPVQVEIDKQKGGGNSRLAARARKASTLFRDILGAPNGYIEFKKAQPTVRLYLRPELKRDESLANQLTYEERDDQLVGIASQFSKENVGSDVTVLTHDTGPMATSQLIGLPFSEIPDSWLLPPEVDEAQKKMNALQAENARLQQAEPSFSVRAESNSEPSSPVYWSIPIYVPLSPDEVASLIESIKSRLPIETDFGSRVPVERKATGTNITARILGDSEKFTPATDDEISTYQSDRYPNWLNECESLFLRIHEELNGRTTWPEVVIIISNTGSRPAADTLVTFAASEQFGIHPPIPQDDDEVPEPELALPLPPSAPKGRWGWYSGKPSAFGIRHVSTMATLPTYDSISPIRSFTRDPNTFYYKNRPHEPVSSFALTCEQFRHRGEEEVFLLTIFAPMCPGTAAGAIEVRVEAANISNPHITQVPIRLMISETNPLSEAEKLIEKLVQKRQTSQDKM